ncbi:kinesin-like protein KIN-7O isoform X2 [Eucalyptus grandis]|uniref:kinesin-like protein KIN-7O isoform X2 n=1 Tax=Eucalyptus grandis TaxID=71139 RepID=UPI00192EAECC|nr:kinesin-like protein KIN-7O isoform X2 [Eucalyptus grandis]
MERIHVSVRPRPLSPDDAGTSPWRISGNSIFMANLPSKFDFDRIFGDDSKTREVYESRTRDIVAAAVRGFNGTVFAYGQTNSGKTHTMRGSKGEPGVIPLSVYDLFDSINKEVGREFLLRMSYMEIYNEEINDLLAPEHRKLQIHENLERGIYVAGLREEIVAAPDQVLDLMEFGEAHRHIGETNMNVYSSRSHTIFRMIIESRDKTEDGDGGSSCDAVRVSVLNLVDLAGSERAAKTGAEGVRLKEGSHINKSLMTLGTVIKKLSEGVESQGGHVPYRDSKLTRILQPALGGNSNTAIICNITLAQIHADETKSSLQFASRALRITNCAHVNEILTDAALLKRQKKEIEELRAKLQGSHSEHLGEEILNLRNTLLQIELERERIALELEEEKKAQAERERRLQEQAKKIENLSSIVLYSNREEIRDNVKKGRRRDTWCPSNLLRETSTEAYSLPDLTDSPFKPGRAKRDNGPLLSFDKLLQDTETHRNIFSNRKKVEDSNLPHPRALQHVTSRRKAAVKNKSAPVVINESVDIHAEYEDLWMESEAQRIANAIQVDCLTRMLTEAELVSYVKQENNVTCPGEPEAHLVIEQLQDQIKVLEIKKTLSQQNLDNYVEMAAENKLSVEKKFEEEGNFDSLVELSMEVQDIMMEVQSLQNYVDGAFLLVDEVFQSFSSVSSTLLDIKTLSSQTSQQQKLVTIHHGRLHDFIKEKVHKFESEKILLQDFSDGLQRQIQELKTDAESSERALVELREQTELEKMELLSQIQNLQKEISCLSSSTLAKERESMRKDLDKTKLKLKETEFKLRNAVQEKTKLEGEKASAEREIKVLHGQKSLLERDINKRESLAGRRRDSIAIDSKRSKGPVVHIDQTMQEEYRRLEVLAFEMEATIASLEEELAAACKEKDEVMSKCESLALELEVQSQNMSNSSSELTGLQEEILKLSGKLEESQSYQQKLEASLTQLVNEKEELAMQLTDSLLEMEEEKAIWSAKEQASIKALEENTKLSNAEITSLSTELSEVKNELESSKEQCKVLREQLKLNEEEKELEREDSMQKTLEIEQLKHALELSDVENKHSQIKMKSELETIYLECNDAYQRANKLQKELDILKKEKEDLIKHRELETGTDLASNLQNLKSEVHNITNERDRLKTQLEEQQRHMAKLESLKISQNDKISEDQVQADILSDRISTMEIKLHTQEVNNGKEKAKLRMRLRWTQAKLDAMRYRCTEALNEQDLMNRKYEEASGKLKDRLASYGTEVLNLKKQLAAAKGHVQP